MPKLVLDALVSEKPSKNSILVYDEKKKAFVETTKQDFLRETNEEIENLKLENKKLQDEIIKFRTQMSQMAKIIKERVI